MGKFDTKEATRTIERSPARSMGGQKAKGDKKLVSFQAATEMYGKFDFINKQRGITNTTALNLMIENYVKEHAEML